MAKTFCKIIGVVFVVLGILGFIFPAMMGLHLSVAQNFIHLTSGAAALYFGYPAQPRAARVFCLAFGVIYSIIGWFGFITPGLVGGLLMTGVHTASGLAPDNVLHIALGGLFLASWYADLPPRAAPL